MSKNIVETEGPQMTSQHGAHALRAGLARLYARMRVHTPTHLVTFMHASMHTQTSLWYLLLFHSNSGVVNAPQWYVIRTLPVLFEIFVKFFSEFNIAKNPWVNRLDDERLVGCLHTATCVLTFQWLMNSVNLIIIFVSSVYFTLVYFKRGTSRDLLCNISFRFYTFNSKIVNIISEKFYRPSIDTVHKVLIINIA